VNKWRKRDPLILTENLLEMTKAEKNAHLENVDAEIEEATRFAENSPMATLESALEDVYA
jgi:TPP-dependent pyruvate/acetoin dehydrogenase alpha subunit